MTPITITIAKLGRDTTIDWEALPQASKDYIIAYGLKQTLNDSIASVSGAEAEGLLAKRVDKLLAGTMGIRSIAAPKDELTQLCHTIARSQLRKALAGRAVSKEDFATLVEQAAEHPSIKELARRELALREGAKDVLATMVGGVKEWEESK